MGFYSNGSVDPGVCSIGVIYRNNTITSPTAGACYISNAELDERRPSARHDDLRA